MRLRARPFTQLLILSQLTSIIRAAPPTHAADLAEAKSTRDAVESPVPGTGSLKSLSAIGKKDAPVDGKDGRPHQGPFVETEAERDRKKAKGSGQDEPVVDTKATSNDLLSTDKSEIAKG